MNGGPPPSSITSLQQISINFLGPRLIGLFLQGFETGVIINQSIQFWTVSLTAEYGTDLEARWTVKGLVLFVTIVALFQTIVMVYDSWNQFVVNFADLHAALEVTWGMKMQAVVTALMAAPVQAFLMWRCWVITKRNWYMLIGLALLWSGSIATSIRICVTVFQIDWVGLTDLMLNMPQEVTTPVDPYFLSSLAFPAALDICLTCILLVFLLRSRSVVVTRRFRRILAQFTIIVWKAALPPCICAFVAMITYISLNRTCQWNLMFQVVLGQLYVISLFININGFRQLKTTEGGLGPSPTTALEHGQWQNSGGRNQTLAQNLDGLLLTSASSSEPHGPQTSLVHSYNRSLRVRSLRRAKSEVFELRHLDIPTRERVRTLKPDVDEKHVGDTTASDITPVDYVPVGQLGSKSRLSLHISSTSTEDVVGTQSMRKDRSSLTPTV